MFRHVLIPVDGSAPATRAAKAGVAFARRIGAKVTVYHAINPIPYGLYASGAEPGDTIGARYFVASQVLARVDVPVGVYR